MISFADCYSHRAGIAIHLNRKLEPYVVIIVKTSLKRVEAGLLIDLKCTLTVRNSPNRRERKAVTQNQTALMTWKQKQCQIEFAMGYQTVLTWQTKRNVITVQLIVFSAAAAARVFQDLRDAMESLIAQTARMKKIVVSD